MITDLIRTLYAYNAWANTRILDTAALLTSEQFVRMGNASFGSIRDTLVHTMVVQANWLHRFQKNNLPVSPETSAFFDAAALNRAWVEIENATQTFVQTLNDEMLGEVISYLNSRGQQCDYKLWQMMVHQVNHATQHRSEVAAMLTEFGHSPGWLDFLVYLDTPT